MTPKDFTAQENLIAKCLDELGLRYAQQVQIDKYTVDFVVEETIILEADGIYGHHSKKDKIRDEALLQAEDKWYNSIIHIKTCSGKQNIKEEIQQKLLCLE